MTGGCGGGCGGCKGGGALEGRAGAQDTKARDGARAKAGRAALMGREVSICAAAAMAVG